MLGWWIGIGVATAMLGPWLAALGWTVLFAARRRARGEGRRGGPPAAPATSAAFEADLARSAVGRRRFTRG